MEEEGSTLLGALAAPSGASPLSTVGCLVAIEPLLSKLLRLFIAFDACRGCWDRPVSETRRGISVCRAGDLCAPCPWPASESPQGGRVSISRYTHAAAAFCLLRKRAAWGDKADGLGARALATRSLPEWLLDKVPDSARCLAKLKGPPKNPDFLLQEKAQD